MKLIKGGQADATNGMPFFKQPIGELLSAGIAVALKATHELTTISKNVESTLSAT